MAGRGSFRNRRAQARGGPRSARRAPASPCGVRGSLPPARPFLSGQRWSQTSAKDRPRRHGAQGQRRAPPGCAELPRPVTPGWHSCRATPAGSLRTTAWLARQPQTRFSARGAPDPPGHTRLPPRTRGRRPCPRPRPPPSQGLRRRRPSSSPRRCRPLLGRRGDRGAGGGGGLVLAALPFNQGYYQSRLAGWRRPSFTPISAGPGGGWAPGPPSVPAAAGARGAQAGARGPAAARAVSGQRFSG